MGELVGEEEGDEEGLEVGENEGEIVKNMSLFPCPEKGDSVSCSSGQASGSMQAYPCIPHLYCASMHLHSQQSPWS